MRCRHLVCCALFSTPFQGKCCTCYSPLLAPASPSGGSRSVWRPGSLSCFSARHGRSTQGPASLGPGFLTAPCLCQSIVGAEGLSLAFRHITSSLLGHCSQVSCESLLHEVIVCVGYFTVNHPDNQVRGPEVFPSTKSEVLG